MDGSVLKLLNSPDEKGADHEDEGHRPGRTCPVCQNTDTVVKAALIVRSGRFRFRLADGNSGECETELARLLGQPPEPRSIPVLSVAAAVIGAWLILALDLAIVEGLRLQDLVTIPSAALDVAVWVGVAWFGLVIPISTVTLLIESRLRLAHTLPVWREAVSRWHNVYYCALDDVAFVPGSDLEPCKPEHASALWMPPRRNRAPVAGSQRLEASRP